MADEKHDQLLKEIEKEEIEYNILLMDTKVQYLSLYSKVLSSSKEVLQKKADYLRYCLANDIEPEIDLEVVGSRIPAMWGASSD